MSQCTALSQAVTAVGGAKKGACCCCCNFWWYSRPADNGNCYLLSGAFLLSSIYHFMVHDLTLVLWLKKDKRLFFWLPAAARKTLCISPRTQSNFWTCSVISRCPLFLSSCMNVHPATSRLTAKSNYCSHKGKYSGARRECSWHAAQKNSSRRFFLQRKIVYFARHLTFAACVKVLSSKPRTILEISLGAL